MSAGKELGEALGRFIGDAGGKVARTIGDMADSVSSKARFEAAQRMLGDTASRIGVPDLSPAAKKVAVEKLAPESRFAKLGYKPKETDFNPQELEDAAYRWHDRNEDVLNLQRTRLDERANDIINEEMDKRGLADRSFNDLRWSRNPDDINTVREIDNLIDLDKQDVEESLLYDAFDEWDRNNADVYDTISSLRARLEDLPYEHPFRRFIPGFDDIDSEANSALDFAQTIKRYENADIPRKQIKYVDNIMTEAFPRNERMQNDFLSTLADIPENMREVYMEGMPAVAKYMDLNKDPNSNLVSFKLYEILQDLSEPQAKEFFGILPEWEGSLYDAADFIKFV